MEKNSGKVVEGNAGPVAQGCGGEQNLAGRGASAINNNPTAKIPVNTQLLFLLGMSLL